MEPTVSMTRTRAHSAIGAAFGKWAKVTKLDFNDVTPSHEVCAQIEQTEIERVIANLIDRFLKKKIDGF